jgi:endonuclease/exonuclease/phosphatase family metal-dependent hydrolase
VRLNLDGQVRKGQITRVVDDTTADVCVFREVTSEDDSGKPHTEYQLECGLTEIKLAATPDERKQDRRFWLKEE